MYLILRLTAEMAKAAMPSLFGSHNPNLHAEQRVDKRGRRSTRWVKNADPAPKPGAAQPGGAFGPLFDALPPVPARKPKAPAVTAKPTAPAMPSLFAGLRLPPVPERAAPPTPPQAQAATTPAPAPAAPTTQPSREERLLGATPGMVASEQLLKNGEGRTAQLLHALGLAQDVFTDPDFHAKIQRPPYMDLHVERIDGGSGTPRVALTHFTSRNGDHYIETEAVYDLHSNGQLKLRETASNAGYSEHRSLDKRFGQMFARNLIEQGFPKGTIIRKDQEAAAPDPAPTPAPQVRYSLTHDEYRRVHKDYKGKAADGTPTQMVNELGGTKLVPVNLIKPDGSLPLDQFENDDINAGKLREGDTKVIGGVTYRLNHNHRWARVADDAPANPNSSSTPDTPTPTTAPASPELSAYVDRLADPKKKTYAQAVAAELAGDAPAEPGDLNPEAAQKVRARVEKYSGTTPAPSAAQPALLPPVPQRDAPQVSPTRPPAPAPAAQEKPEKVELRRTGALDYTQPFQDVLPNVPRYAFDLLQKSTRATRKKANDAALALARRLHRTSTAPTPEERATLAQWSGQGGVDHDLNAYYTPTRLAAAMWALAHQHGFTGGRVLEPSIGGGVFAETAPGTAQMTGVEYNPETASVTQLLQPDTQIHVMPFEQYHTTSDDDQYDLVIGNPPYGTRGQTRDLDRPEFGEAEQYFIEAALDRVKDGGLVTVLVPFSVMQNGNARAFRARLLARAELVTAVRAPVSTFEDANAFVTPDVLVLRKRPTEVGGAVAHLVSKHGEQALKDAGLYREDVMSGHYFAQPEYDGDGNLTGYRDGFHPDRALGRNVASGRWGQAAVDGDLDDRSLEQLAAMPADQSSAAEFHPQTWAAARAALATAGYSDTDLSAAELRGQSSQYPIPEGTVSADGEYVMRGHRWHRIDDEAGAVEEAKSLARALERYRSDLNGGRTELAEAARASLAAQVQRFMETEAAHLPTLRRAADERLPYLNHLLSSHDGTSLSADLTESQHTLPDAEELNLSDPHSVARHLARRGALTPDALSSMTGMGHDSARAFLIHGDDYAWDGESWRTARDYYVGDVYDAQDALARLIEATPQADLREKLEGQATRFQQLLPRKTIDEINLRPRAKFIPVDVLEDYLNDKFNMRLDGHNALKLTLEDGVYSAEVDTGQASWWIAKNRVRDLNKAAVQEYLHMLNNKTRVDAIQGKDDMTREEYQAARKAAIDAAKAYEDQESQAFRTWLMSSDHQDAVEDAYNRQLNSYLQPTENYDDLNLPGWTGPSLHPYQNNAVRRMTATGTGIVALDVGLGKTFTGLALAASLKRDGKARKPVLVAPKSLLGNWVKNAATATPGARVLVIGMTEKNGKWVEDSAEEKRRKLTLASAQDWDLVIMSRDTFEDIPMRRDRRLDLIQSDFQAQRQLGLRGRQKFEKNKKPSERQSEKERQEFFEKQLQKVSSAGPTDVAFEDLGFDCVISDEGHAYKNLYAAPTVFGENPKFMGAGAESNRAMDFHHKMRHVRSVNNGRGTYILTATPTKNSPLEIYNMLALVSDSLKTHGLPGVDDFIDRYCDIQATIVPTKDGSVKSLPAVVGFQNLPELRGIMDRYLIREDARTALTKDGIGLKMPKRQDIEQYFDLSDDARYQYDMLRIRANAVKQGDKGEDHLFSIMAQMRKLTMDPALFDKDLADQPNPRFLKAAELAKAGLDEGGKVVAFMDLGQVTDDDDGDAKGSGPDAYDRLVDHFVQAGIPRDQIAVVTAQRAKKASDRSKVEDAFQRGDIRVVIGNTPTIGEGFNLQNGTTDMIHLDTPWDPGTYWQRLGRAERQGNPVDTVRNHVLLARGSFDGVTYSTMLGKKGWQQQVWDRSVTSATNNVGLDLEEIALALSDDPEATREQIKKAREDLNKGAAAAATRTAMKDFSQYLDTRSAWLKRAKEARGRKDGPTDNDRRILEKLERNLKAARTALKGNASFEKAASLLDYPGEIRMTPGGVPLHQGMTFSMHLRDEVGEMTPRTVEVDELYPDGRIGLQVQGGRRFTIKGEDLPAIGEWSPNADPRMFYDGLYERPAFAKARTIDAGMQFVVRSNLQELPPVPRIQA
ncbi:SNF2-related protein [Deinococcus sp. PEB2-67]